MSDQITTKTCSKCKIEQPLEEFGKRNDRKIGLRSQCRLCINLAQRDPGAPARREARALEANPEFQMCKICKSIKPASDFGRSKKTISKLKHDCKSCLTIQSRAQKGFNNPRVKRWALRDAGYFDCDLCGKRLSIDEKVQRTQYLCKFCYNRSYRKRYPYDPEKGRLRALRHPQKGIRDAAIRRGRMKRAKGTFTTEQLRARFDFFGNRCIYCNSMEKLTIEHLIPLSRGGANWPSNLAPSCSKCNARKHTKTHKEFLVWLEDDARLDTTRHP